MWRSDCQIYRLFFLLSQYQILIFSRLFWCVILLHWYFDWRSTRMMIDILIFATEHINRSRFLLLHLQIQASINLEFITVILHYYYITYLSCRKVIHHGLIFCCYFYLLMIVAVWYKWCCEFVSCLWIILWLY